MICTLKPLLFFLRRTGATFGRVVGAQAAGYEDVRILPAGIKGWAKAGQPTKAPGS